MYRLDRQKIEQLRCQKNLRKNQLATAVRYSSYSGFARFEETGCVKSKLKVLAFCKALDIEDPSEILIFPKTLHKSKDYVWEYFMAMTGKTSAD